MTASRRWAAFWILAAAAGATVAEVAAATLAQATDIPDVTLSGVASGAALKVGFEGNGKRVLPQTIYLRGNRTRLEFHSTDQQGYLLRDGSRVWLVNEKAKLAWPLQYRSGARQYKFNASEPCKDLDISCEREGKKTIAGREASGWRFRHAGTRGPDGSDSGTMWIDDQYGLLLGYHAEDMQGHALDWTVTTVSFDNLPAELFELPAGGKRPTG